jgi:hypothetical protein
LFTRHGKFLATIVHVYLLNQGGMGREVALRSNGVTRKAGLLSEGKGAGMREGRIEGERKDGKREKGEHEGRGERRSSLNTHLNVYNFVLSSTSG